MAHAHAELRAARDARLLGDVGERAVAVVLVERVLERRLRLVEVGRAAVDQEDVHPAVVVVVEERARPGPWSRAGSGSGDIALSWTQLMPDSAAGTSVKAGLAPLRPRGTRSAPLETSATEWRKARRLSRRAINADDISDIRTRHFQLPMYLLSGSRDRIQDSVLVIFTLTEDLR